MAILIKAQIKNLSLKEIQEELDNQNRIWSNINEKLIRTFRRVEYHNKGLNITADPFLIDSNLHMVLENNIECNNPLLNETISVFQLIDSPPLKQGK